MREPENICRVEMLDVDWMGFIFYKNSSRFVGTVPAYLPNRQKRVGVFVNTNKDGILLRTAAFRLDLIQLHGQESPTFVKELHDLLPTVPLIKAFGICDSSDFQQVLTYEGLCQYYLFDTQCVTAGGSGKSFDWSILSAYQGSTPFILSGGIGPESLSALQNLNHPQWAGIDLNSRFETAPALKDVNLLQTFVSSVRTMLL